jgi:hypothetical protein
MPGPPPKREPVRRNARVGTLKLPAEGRRGEVPDWPLASRPTVAEKAAWIELWSTPQAVAWERFGWTRTVARYCRVMVAAEKPRAASTLLGQATALEDRLGLTPKSMRALLWEIAYDEVAEQRESAPDVRERIRAVE